MKNQQTMRARMLAEANEVYPDGMIEAYFHLDTGEEKKDPHLDTLALFIGREIADLVDEDASTETNREIIDSALTTAALEIDAVIAHFRGLR